MGFHVLPVSHGLEQAQDVRLHGGELELRRDLGNAPALGDEQPEEEAPGLAGIVTHATIIIDNRHI